MKAVAVISVRYVSSHLSSKPLLDSCGKPLIQEVWEVVSRARGLDEVVGTTFRELTDESSRKQAGGIT